MQADISTTTGYAGSLAVPDIVDGEIIYDSHAGAIERVLNGVVVSTYNLPKALVYPRGGGPSAHPFLAPPQVTALAIDDAGNVWFVLGGKQLMKLDRN